MSASLGSAAVEVLPLALVIARVVEAVVQRGDVLTGHEPVALDLMEHRQRRRGVRLDGGLGFGFLAAATIASAWAAVAPYFRLSRSMYETSGSRTRGAAESSSKARQTTSTESRWGNCASAASRRRLPT